MIAAAAGTAPESRIPAVTTSSGVAAGGIAKRDLRNERIRIVMRGQPLVVPSGTTLAAGISRIQEARADCLLVREGDGLVGILTERDVLMKVLGRPVDPAASVDAYMTAHPDTLSADSTVGDALALMDRGGYRHVPIVDGKGRVAGLLRQQDVLEYLAEAFPEEILNLPPRPHQRMEEPDGA